MSQAKRDLLPVLLDCLHAYAPSLFMSPSKHRKRQPFVREFSYDGNRVEVFGRKSPNAFDLLVLLAVLYLARRNAESDANAVLTEGLELEGDYKGASHVWLKITYADLARHMGLPRAGGDLIIRLKDSFKTLMSLGFFVRNLNTQEEGGFHLFSYAAKRGRIEVGLDPFLSRALSGGRNYTLLSLGESRKLSDPARILHLHLCSRANKGQKTAFRRSQLESVPWADAATDATVRKRRERFDAALAEIGALSGWQLAVDGDHIEVTRP